MATPPAGKPVCADCYDRNHDGEPHVYAPGRLDIRCSDCGLPTRDGVFLTTVTLVSSPNGHQRPH